MFPAGRISVPETCSSVCQWKKYYQQPNHSKGGHQSCGQISPFLAQKHSVNFQKTMINIMQYILCKFSKLSKKRSFFTFKGEYNGMAQRNQVVLKSMQWKILLTLFCFQLPYFPHVIFTSNYIFQFLINLSKVSLGNK